MSILYKTIRKAEPGVAGGGQYKFYAGIVREREATLREMVKEISSRSTVTTADAFAVIENFLELVPKFLRNGRNVNLGQLGRFKVNLKSKGHELPGEVSNYSILGSKVSFTPSLEMKEELMTIRYTKAAGHEQDFEEEAE
ncbi:MULTISPECIES: HU family DNA-binding protein [unclassified Imperialibacter]|uniref:HU family DNA-binding protein n=1 Tax=unclassified Imperialibacter TaxID=2629706 RepID=UPI0012585D49|nr:MULTISPECIES: HU family DNA-binding protein [unclassified Imperialibacter]CAD5249045.1 putative DNA-binding protein, histone-like [Imperialibacter sp. 89]CAD5263934.1 putative DNA-binding protein, histone-like [Imperialibacter sp. 75]VVT07296.1 putative DNA-binding protein, histone-like [Imperialibacter sp. EC-SDR9]